ncbi:MAG: glycoside hydrolase [Bacteroidales bacterium]|nr:glycoside hydrolase [Bacteroidales bacterium]
MKKTFAALFLLMSVQAIWAEGLLNSVSWDNIRSHPAPLPVSGELAARPSSLDAPSIWSVGVEAMDRGYGVFSEFSKYVGETGVGYGRLQSGWARTETKKGKYDFAWLDEHVDGLLAQGVHPWMCLCYGNALYTRGGTGLDAKLFPDGPVMDAWLKYIRTVVSRYRGKITMWEIWNEPNGPNNLDSYPLYANLFVRTAKVIREVDPDAKIAAFASWSPDLDYIRQAMELIAAADGVKYIDCITVHAYFQIPETIIPAMEKLRRDIDVYNPGIVLLQGEAGCPSHLEYAPSSLKDVDWTETSQAKWELRHMLNFYSLGVPTSVFTMVDLRYDWKLQTFGLIRMDLRKRPVYKRPKFYAVQHVTSVFTPDLVPVDGVTVNCALPRDIRCVGLAKKGKTVGCLLWFGGATPTPSLDRTMVDLGIGGIDFRDPVYVDLLTGYIHDMSGIVLRGLHNDCGTQLRGLPLWDCPVMVIERDAL